MDRSRSKALPFVVLLPLVAACLGCPPSPARSTPESSPAPRPPTPVEVRVVQPEPVSIVPSYPSSLYVERDVRLRARRSGMIMRIHAERGERVHAGQVLAELETDLATAELAMAEQEQRMADVDYESKRSLRDQQIVSSNEFLKAETARDLAVSRSELARNLLERCNVRAPFDGVVVERWAQLGERVQEDEDTPLFRVVASDPLRARIDVPEDRLAGLAPGAAAELESEGLQSFPGKVVFVSPTVDASSGTVPVIVEAQAGGARLRPGASVRVRLAPSKDASPAFRIPSAAAQAEGEREATLLLLYEGRAQSRRVRILEHQADALVVSGALAAEDLVILKDRAVAPGDLVQVRREEP